MLPYPEGFQYGIGAFRIENNDYGLLIIAYGKRYPPTTTKEIIELLQPNMAKDHTGMIRKVLEEWEQVTGKNKYSHWPLVYIQLTFYYFRLGSLS